MRSIVSGRGHIRDRPREPGENRLKSPDKLLEQMNPGAKRAVDVGLDRIFAVEIDDFDGA